MHQALLIDEILENILDSCSDGNSLGRIARTCQAWKEPALNRLWRRLTCIVPLLQLIPGLKEVHGVYVLDISISPDLRVFFSYASRVKYLVHRHRIRLDSSVTSLLVSQKVSEDPIFSRLSMVQLSLANCPSLGLVFNQARRLRSIDLDLGFKTSSSGQSNYAAIGLLQNAHDLTPGLESLSIRGYASDGLLNTIASLSMLKSLSLRLGHTTSVDVLVATSKFPLLASLELQAVGVDIEEMDQKWESSAEADSFSALTTLDIRGCISFIHTFVQNMRSKHLFKLHMDIDPSAHSDNDDSWMTLFDSVGNKFSDTLHDLAIEYHTEHDDLRLNVNPNNTIHVTTHDTLSSNVSSSDRKFNDFLGFDILYPLTNARNLHRVVFDTSPPLAIRDQDFDHIVKFWPNLEHFELGSLQSTLDPAWTPYTTVKSLVTLSKGLGSLRTLIMPIDSSGLDAKAIDDLPSGTNNSLHTISITTVSSPPNSTTMGTCLNRLFSSLREIEIHSESL
ncbi:hypothetical protein K435DRAFT_836332 [Dendrothele bispora CBS 962.96]|uniref:F-box domain-containing protein n=1 Tax=Dendrothele bispora (strain CBS 962.96) TaxID=1314807 RepID=A0A4S8MIA2_DENBC|nr:hypothetical protein K435DRAFT_836332 [Dendrothele bispora CBS 962.96]